MATFGFVLMLLSPGPVSGHFEERSSPKLAAVSLSAQNQALQELTRLKLTSETSFNKQPNLVNPNHFANSIFIWIKKL